MKKFLLSAICVLMALFAQAQIYDGITQPTTYRFAIPATVSTENGSSSIAPSIGYIEYEKVEEIIKEIGESDILGFPMDYVDAILGEMKTDAMGVDLTSSVTQQEVNNPKPANEEQARQKQSDAPSPLQQFEQGAQQARVIKCPHCGKEITL